MSQNSPAPFAADTGVLDLDAYFARIGYDGPRAATADTLRALHRLHPQAISFENLDPFLGHPVQLDVRSLEDKLIGGRRGGYCFEQNFLLWKALEALGFGVRGLGARVLWGRAEDTIMPRTHMLLRVEAKGAAWLCDVGFGGLTQTAPLSFEPGLEQRTPHEAFRLVGSDPDFRVQVRMEGDWRTLYRFDLSEQYAADYTISNYYLSTNPASMFVRSLLAARALPGRRYALLGNRLTIHETDGASTRREISSPDELVDVLDTMFDVAVPDPAAFARIAREKGLFPAGGGA